MSVVALNRSLEQELFALERGASLECLVCGEFVLVSGDEIRCLECGARLPVEKKPGLQLSMQAG